MIRVNPTNPSNTSASLRTLSKPASPFAASLRSPTSLKATPAAGADLTGKVAFIAGVADSTGYGWAIARKLADAGATIVVGTWPPVLKIFQIGLRK